MTMFKREEVESLSQLLARWKLLLGVYERMAREQYDDSPARNQMIYTMGNQLSRCITELEKTMKGDPIRAALAESIIKSNKE